MADKQTGYKGFNKDFKCRDYQFKVGKTAIHKGDIRLCESGLHFCEHPLDIFTYYPPSESRYAEVDAEGVSAQRSDDSKRVAKRLHIKAELTLRGIIDAAIKFTFNRVDWTKKETQASGDHGAAQASGDQGAAHASGDHGAAQASGYKGAAQAIGYKGAAQASGKEGYAAALGMEGRARAAKGGWIAVAEWEKIADEWHRVNIKVAKVDGEKIKPDTFYRLEKGEFVVAE